MPRLTRGCSALGCTNVHTNKKYCDKHLYLEEEKRKEIDKRYRYNRTDSKEIQFYNSKDWKRARATRLNLDNYLCQSCKANLATMVHHIIEVKKDFNKRLDINNLISLCESCHRKIHSKK